MTMFFKRDKPSLPANARFKITQNGRDKMGENDRDIKTRILTVLDGHGTSDLDEISMYAQLPRGQVEREMPKLIPHYVQYVRATEQGD